MARTYYGDLESADKTVFMFDSHGSSKTDLKDGVFTVIVNTETEEAVAETYDTITAEQYSEFCCTVSAIQRIHPTRPPQWK